MAKSSQLGYNHNIPHRGRLYHVQTEDSGLEKAHIFTHVFYDGTIIATNKVLYDAHAQVEDLDQHVIGLMQDSHKAIIRQLRRGAFDEKIVTFIGEHPEAAHRSAEAPDGTPEPAGARDERVERRPPPEPRAVELHGPPLAPGRAGPTVDPVVTHPVFSSPEAQAEVAASAAGHGKQRATRGPSRIRRRAVGGIGGKGVAVGADTHLAERRDIIVGKFASEHQVELDEEILALLREE